MQRPYQYASYDAKQVSQRAEIVSRYPSETTLFLRYVYIHFPCENLGSINWPALNVNLLVRVKPDHILALGVKVAEE